MFSQASVILFTGGHMHDRGCVGGLAWQGACIAEGACVSGVGHAWQGVCMVGGVHGRGCAW